MSRNIALTIEYDGTAFRGWQLQPGQRTVEGEIEKALEAITGHKADLFGASRTDAGVHARGQVAHFKTHSKIPTAKVQGYLNQILPDDIVVLHVEEKPEDFHARHDAKGKWYRYAVFPRQFRPAMERDIVLHSKQKLRMAPMEAAAKLLIGKHDFISFGVNSRKDEEEDTVKTMHAVCVSKDGEKVLFDIVGSSFLYRMVRSMVGTLIEIGKGKRHPECITAILEKKDRSAAGVTVPPQGLTLMRVFYDDPSGFQPSPK